MPTTSRLARSSDRVIAGVCGGIAEFVGWSPAAVRALYVFASIVSAGFPGIFVYLILWWVMPTSPPRFDLADYRQQ